MDPFSKDTWQLDPNITFLNHGSFGALAKPIHDTATDLRNQLENSPVEFILEIFTPQYNSIKESVAKHFCADNNRFAFVPNATFASNTVLTAFDFDFGDEIIITDQCYVGIFQMAEFLKNKYGVSIKIAPIPVPISSNEEILKSIEKQISAKTKLIICDHISSPTGVIFPVKNIAEMAKRHGVPLYIDGAHAPGQLPLDLEDIGADFYSGNFHKWFLAPKTAAFLYVDTKWCNKIHNPIIANAFHRGFPIDCSWWGTYDPTPIMTLPKCLEVLNAWDQNKISAHNTQLLNGAKQILESKIALTFFTHVEALRGYLLAAMIPSLNADEYDVFKLRKEFYDRYQMELHFTSLHRQIVIRASAYTYNAAEDYERLSKNLAEFLNDKRA